MFNIVVFVASGNHSPIGSINGGTMSPNLLVNSSVSQQLPPACGARQLSKLKRFLTTLQQFGSDISPEIGERVRTLVLALVVSKILEKELRYRSRNGFWSISFCLVTRLTNFLHSNLANKVINTSLHATTSKEIREFLSSHSLQFITLIT